MNLAKSIKSLLAPASIGVSVLALAACGAPKPVTSSSQVQSSSSAPVVISSSSVVVSSSSVAVSSSNNSGTPSLLSSGGTFASGGENFGDWFSAADGANAAVSYNNGYADITISQISTAPEVWHVQLQHLVSINSGQTYTICYKAKAAAARSIGVDIDTGDPDYASVNPAGAYTVSLSTNYQSFKHTFSANTTDASSRLLFNAGASTANVQIDDVGVYAGSECGALGQSGSSSSQGNTNVNGVLPIRTQGNKVLFGGQPGSIAGMSLFWSNAGWGGEKYYNADVVSYLKNNWKAKLIRIAMGVDPLTGEGTPSGAYLDGANKQLQLNMATTVIDAAIANEMYVIIDWHTHHAENFTSDAVQFFSQISAQYGNYDNIIYEIYNEPLSVSWSNTIKPYAQQVIQAIRANDPDNLIIVGTPVWSQNVDEAAANPINDVNVAYTLHFYAGTHKGPLRDKASQALAAGIPLFVTEWGAVNADGDGAVNAGEVSTWMTFLRNNNISHANWALNDKLEGASALTPGSSANGGWSDANLTASGKLIKDIIANW